MLAPTGDTLRHDVNVELSGDFLPLSIDINPSVAVASKSLSDVVPPNKDIVSDVVPLDKGKVSSPDDGPQAISDVA